MSQHVLCVRGPTMDVGYACQMEELAERRVGRVGAAEEWRNGYPRCQIGSLVL